MMDMIANLWLSTDLLSKITGKKKSGVNKSPIPVLEEPFFAPGQGSSLHTGFVNNPQNPVGLKIQFQYRQGGGIGCHWVSSNPGHEGYPGIVHGGVVSALLDELMANALVQKFDLFGVSVRACVDWHRPVKSGSVVLGEAHVTARVKRLVYCRAQLINEAGSQLASARGIFYLPTLKQFSRLASQEIDPTFGKHFYGGPS
jgi:uncharacterized protein (TIGR00369 family)